MFNWVHTKFHYNPMKDWNASKKNTESITKEAKRQGLAKQVDEIIDILDDWRINGRRLTIFLMGSERSSKPKIYKAEYFNLKKDGKRYNEIVDNIVDNDDCDDELSPLMATTFQNNFDDNGEFCTDFEKFQIVVAIERHVAQRLRRRVTLAELFMVENTGRKPKPAPEKVVAEDLRKKLPDVESAGSSCFADKPKVAAELPARNLRRLMKKMTKRKIHAEVDHEILLGEKKLTNDHKSYGKLFSFSNSSCFCLRSHHLPS